MSYEEGIARHLVTKVSAHRDVPGVPPEEKAARRLFLAKYASEEQPKWVAAWEFYYYDEQGELYITEAYTSYCRKAGLSVEEAAPTQAQLEAIVRSHEFA